MSKQKSIFAWRKTPYYSAEICGAILVVSIVISLLTKSDAPLKLCLIVIPSLLAIFITVDGIRTIRPLIRDGRWGKAMVRFLPYLLGITILSIIIVTMTQSLTQR